MSSGRSAERWKYPWLSVCNERPRVHLTAWFSLAVGYLLQDRAGISELGRMLRRALCILALSAGIASCDAIGFKNWSWSQRLVLEVKTPAGIVSDGSVVVIAAGASPTWLLGHGAAGMSGRVAGGEASFV